MAQDDNRLVLARGRRLPAGVSAAARAKAHRHKQRRIQQS
jgi:hypothetical protein